MLMVHGKQMDFLLKQGTNQISTKNPWDCIP